MKLKINQGANERTNAIAYPDEFRSPSYSANLSGDADALLGTQLTELGYLSVNYEEYLNVTLRLDSTSFSELCMMLVCKHREF